MQIIRRSQDTKAKEERDKVVSTVLGEPEFVDVESITELRLYRFL